MKSCHNFFLMVIGFFYFVSPSQAAIIDKAFVLDVPYVDSSVSLLPTVSLTKTALIIPSSSALGEEKLLRKTMHINTMVQRSWISSMIVPGLGQMYNKHYWKVPFLYLGFVILGHRIYSEHQEMNVHKRTKFLVAQSVAEVKQNSPTTEFTQKRIQDCKRTRNLFIIIAAAWYLLNVFDAYAGAHGRTVNFSDDIYTIPSPTQRIMVTPTANMSTVSLSLPICF
jgi:hypothetical protein